MKLKRNMYLTFTSAALFWLSTAAVTPAQQDGDKQNDRSRTSQRKSSQREQDERTADQRKGDQQQSHGEQKAAQQEGRDKLRLSPTGWVRVATDYDNDGHFDALETIYFYDLQRARDTSRARANRDAQQSSASKSGRSSRQQHTVKGEIQELRQDQLAGIEGKCVIARLETQDGKTAKACLGPQSQLSKLQLSKGDQITVKGFRGHINDRTMLIATHVSSGQDEVAVDMPSGRHLKRVRGEVLSTRTAKFRGHDESHVVGKVELVSGKQETINFGPQSKLNKLDLNKGDEVAVLVRPGRVNGQRAMIAEQIFAKGKTVDVPRSDDSKRFASNQLRQQRDERAYGGDDRNPQSDDRKRQSYDRNQQQRDDRVTYDGRERAALGIMLSEDPQSGVQIQGVVSESPAERAGLQQGDRILSVNDRQINNYRDVLLALRQHDPQDRVEIEVRRDGSTESIDVQLGSRSGIFDRRD